jgi:hypothetical protein
MPSPRDSAIIVAHRVASFGQHVRRRRASVLVSPPVGSSLTLKQANICSCFFFRKGPAPASICSCFDPAKYVSFQISNSYQI